jgi:hypothetical protein
MICFSISKNYESGAAFNGQVTINWYRNYTNLLNAYKSGLWIRIDFKPDPDIDPSVNKKIPVPVEIRNTWS